MYAQNRTDFAQGGYRAVMNMTITNHKDIPADIEIKINKYQGDNLSFKWDVENSAPLSKVSASELKVTQILKAN